MESILEKQQSQPSVVPHHLGSFYKYHIRALPQETLDSQLPAGEELGINYLKFSSDF